MLQQNLIPYPHACGFCDRNTFHARKWTHRCNHLSRHFKNGFTITAWKDWAEEDDSWEDDGEERPTEGWPNSGGPDDDDDDDENHSHDNNDGGNNFDNDHSTHPPSLDPDNGNGFSAPFNPAPDHDHLFKDFLTDWSANNPSEQITVVSLLPLANFVDEDSQLCSSYPLPVKWIEKINRKGGTSAIYKVSIPQSAFPSAFNKPMDPNSSLDSAVKQYSS
jgi:hypothetical protein